VPLPRPSVRVTTRALARYRGGKLHFLSGCGQLLSVDLELDHAVPSTTDLYECRYKFGVTRGVCVGTIADTERVKLRGLT
jgi:hypothetical protein